MLGQAAQATISYPKLPQGNSCFPDDASGVEFHIRDISSMDEVTQTAFSAFGNIRY